MSIKNRQPHGIFFSDGPQQWRQDATHHGKTADGLSPDKNHGKTAGE